HDRAVSARLALLAERTHSPIHILALDDLNSAKALEVVGFLWPTSRCRDLKPAFGKDRDCDRTHASGSACHNQRSALRFEPVSLERNHGKHGGIAGSADRHGVACAHARWQPHQPVALDARLLRIGTEMRLTETPAVEDDLVAGLPVRMR